MAIKVEKHFQITLEFTNGVKMQHLTRYALPEDYSGNFKKGVPPPDAGTGRLKIWTLDNRTYIYERHSLRRYWIEEVTE